MTAERSFRMNDDPARHVGGHRPPLQVRLSRLDRVFVDHPLYFVTACTAGRRNLLANTLIHDACVGFARRGFEHGAFVSRYVLMPDHLHLFVTINPRCDLTLSNWMKSLKNSLSKILRASGRMAPHWQRNFFDHLLRSGESYSQKWDYVFLNPQRAGLVKRPEEWPYQGEICELPFD